MVNWNTSLFYVRVCLPAPLERPDVCTMNAKICEDGDHLSKSEQIGVLFGFPCDVRYFAFLHDVWLSLKCATWRSQLGWMNFQTSGHARKFFRCMNFTHSCSQLQNIDTQAAKFNASPSRCGFSLSKRCVWLSRGPWATSMIYSPKLVLVSPSAIKNSYLFTIFLSSPYRSREATLPRCVGLVPNF